MKISDSAGEKYGFGDSTVLSFVNRFLPWTAAGQEPKSRWQMAKTRLVVLGVFCFMLGAFIIVCLWLVRLQPLHNPITESNARLLSARGTLRAEAEKILGPSGTLIRPRDGRDRAIKWRDQPATFPVPMFDEIKGADYAIQWGSPGHFIRIYFDKDDRVVGLEGSTTADPPTFSEIVRKWVLREP